MVDLDSGPVAKTNRPQVTWTTAFKVCAATLLVAGGVYFTVKTVLSLTLTIIAAMIAVALDNAISVLEKRQVRKPLAIAVVMSGLIGLLIAFFILVIPPAVKQGEALVREEPQLWANFQKSHTFVALDERLQLRDRLSAVQSNAVNVLKGAVTPILAVIGSVFTTVAAVVTVLFLVLFMLIYGGPFIQATLTEVFPAQRLRYLSVLQKIYASVGGYLRGALFICAINCTCTTVWLAVNKTPFFLPLGIVSGMSSLVPYVGTAVTGASITLIMLTVGGVWKALGTAIYFVIYGQVEGNILGPIVFKKTVHINPLVTLLSILFLAEFAGIFGAVLAVPFAAALQILVREIIASRKDAVQLTLGDGNP